MLSTSRATDPPVPFGPASLSLMWSTAARPHTILIVDLHVCLEQMPSRARAVLQERPRVNAHARAHPSPLSARGPIAKHGKTKTLDGSTAKETRPLAWYEYALCCIGGNIIL